MRIIPKIEIKNNTLVKGISFEGLRVLGSPDFFIDHYETSIAHEFFLIDVTASLYGLPFNFSYLKKYCENISVPITISGGLRNTKDIDDAFQSGADKIALNTYLFEDITIIKKIKNIYGKQAVTANVEVMNLDNTYSVYTEFGREKKNIKLNDWIKTLLDNGVGEIACSSINNDGKQLGADYKLLEILSEVNQVPIIYSGGIKSVDEINKIKKNFNIDGLLIGSLFHYDLISQEEKQIKNFESKIGNIDFIKGKRIFEKINEDTKTKLDFTKLKKNININLDKKLKFGVLNLKNGNIFSIKNLFKKNNIDLNLTNDPVKLSELDVLIISGDGNCNHSLLEIENNNLYPILKYFFEKKSIIGICSGMQILFEESHEDEVKKGLGFFNGKIKKIREKEIKLPNVGWRNIKKFKEDSLNIHDKNFYFMHSYCVKDFDKNECIYYSNYFNEQIPSIFKKNNSYAFQFHPEKSGLNGIELLKTVLENY